MTVEPRRYTASVDRPETLDVGARWLDVRRVAKSHPHWRRCLRAGWDADDLVNEVMVRVLARQAMASRYDPRRAGLGKYLWTLTGSILANLAVSVRHLGSEDLLEDGATLDTEPDPDEVDPVDGLEW